MLSVYMELCFWSWLSGFYWNNCPKYDYYKFWKILKLCMTLENYVRHYKQPQTGTFQRDICSPL